MATPPITVAYDDATTTVERVSDLVADGHLAICSVGRRDLRLLIEVNAELDDATSVVP